MANYLVTGGCGFVGSHLAGALVAAGHRVRILDDLSTGRVEKTPPEAEVILGDVADSARVAQAMTGVDGCFHLAAVASVQRSNEAWLETHRVNAGGTICILETARTTRMPVVFASSAAVYGHQIDSHALESSPLAPLTAYGADKVASELHARVASLVHGVPTLGLRFFNVYGPGQDASSPYSGVISIFIRRVLEGAELAIYGDGRQIRDFVYVGDVVRFLLAGMAVVGREPRVFNVCTGVPTSIRELAATIEHLCDRPATVRLHPPRAGDIRTSLGSPELAATELGVRARVGLQAGLSTTIESFG